MAKDAGPLSGIADKTRVSIKGCLKWESSQERAFAATNILRHAVKSAGPISDINDGSVALSVPVSRPHPQHQQPLMLILIHVFCFIYTSAFCDARSVQDASNVIWGLLHPFLSQCVVLLFRSQARRTPCMRLQSR